MKRYCVTITKSYDIMVDAEDEQEAIDLANDFLDNSDDAFYNYDESYSVEEAGEALCEDEDEYWAAQEEEEYDEEYDDDDAEYWAAQEEDYDE